MRRSRVEVAAPLRVRERARGIWPNSASPLVVEDRAERFLALSVQCAFYTETEDDLFALGCSLDVPTWRRVSMRAREEGLSGLVLVYACKVGLFRLMPAGVAEALLDAYRLAWIGNRRLRGVLAEVLAALAVYGVEAIPFKGVALTERYYEELALRPAGDLDLLVRRADLKACQAALEALGCRPTPERSRPRSFYPLFYRALIYEHPLGFTIEVHWELITLPLYLSAVRADAALWGRAEHIAILGQPARYLAPADELRYLAVHAIVQHADLRRAIWLVDIAELIRHLPPTWDWDAFAEETRRLGLAGPVMAALLAVRKLSRVSVPRGALDTLIRASASPREQRAWRRSFGRDAGVQTPGAVLRHLRAQDTLLNRIILLWHLTGRARRRWLRQARGKFSRRARVDSAPQQALATSLAQEEPTTQILQAVQTIQTMHAMQAREDGKRSIPGLEDQDTMPLPALLYSSGPLPALAKSSTAMTRQPASYFPPSGTGWGPDHNEVHDGVARSGRAPRRGYRFAKRILDLSVAGVLLMLSAPLWALLAFLIKLDGGPVVFRRQLVGYHGRPFYELKFRTMRPDAELLLAMDAELAMLLSQNFKLPDDPRVTPIGRWLRRWSVDELPQLWNVVRGDMSLVGPRPVHRNELTLFGDFATQRQSVPPGITGLWQVSGRSDVTYDERIRLDQKYVQTCSFGGDVLILLRTVAAVLRADGAY